VGGDPTFVYDLGVYGNFFELFESVDRWSALSNFFLCGADVWNFISRSIITGSTSLIQGGGLVKKVYFPREVLPLATVVSSLVDFVISALILVVMMIIYRIIPSWHLVFVPLLFLVQVAMAMAFALISSAMTVVFRDLQFVIPFLTQLLMYASPVIYTVRNLRPDLKLLMFLNPITGVIEGYRSILIYHQITNMIYLVISIGFTLVLLIGSYNLFKRIERYLADVI